MHRSFAECVLVDTDVPDEKFCITFSSVKTIQLFHC